jgi:hypothetical protein
VILNAGDMTSSVGTLVFKVQEFVSYGDDTKPSNPAAVCTGKPHSVTETPFDKCVPHCPQPGPSPFPVYCWSEKFIMNQKGYFRDIYEPAGVDDANCSGTPKEVAEDYPVSKCDITVSKCESNCQPHTCNCPMKPNGYEPQHKYEYIGYNSVISNATANAHV